MSQAWEITLEDIRTILCEHDAEDQSDEECEQILDEIDADNVESAVLQFTDFDDQVSASSCELEDQMIEIGYINHPKRFDSPEECD